MRKFLTFAALFAISVTALAQTTNLAISNDGTGRVEAYTITELDDCSAATFQMWIRPTAWTAATLIGQDNFSLKMSSTAGQFTMAVGDLTANFAASEDLVNVWSQLTVTVDNGTVKAYINNAEVAVTGNVANTFAPTASAFDVADCIIAEGLKGEIDEVRVWNMVLAQEDFLWQNTVNHLNDNYNALVAYWKFDQELLTNNVLDYRNVKSDWANHNGNMVDVSKKAVTDNELFRYRVVAGYVPSMMRFTDRPYINREMFLLTNDVLTLSAKVQSDGSLFLEYPDNSATPTAVDYLAEWQGREGVMVFKGNGSQMVADYGCTIYNSTESSGRGRAAKASIETWLYIDSWNEGAEIYSSRIDDSQYVAITLGSEADKSVIVDVNGTTATLSGQLEVGKWQYLGCYMCPSVGKPSDRFFNPISIGVGAYDEGGEFQSKVYSKMTSPAVVLGGLNMTDALLPDFSNATTTIGKNLNGKLDNFMVWAGEAGDRSNSLVNDATTEFQWNVGNWNNIFLTAYYKGDDPDNIGKDSQSAYSMADIMRGYFKNYSGWKIRIGIISSLSGEGWKNVYSQTANVDRLIESAKEIVKHFDGLDIDLEWMYSQSDWNIYNNLVSRLINEVMADYPEKIFSCSLHQVSYSGFDKSLLPDVDYFTFQQYGPNIFPQYDNWESWSTTWLNWGFPKEKILMSYSTLIMTGNSEEGYKDLFDSYGMNDNNFDPDVDTWKTAGNTYYFNGLTQVKKRQQHIIDKDLRGTMYFDMANDLYVTDYKSLIRAQNEVLSANVDTIVTEVKKPAGVRNIAATQKAELFTAVQDGSNINVTLSDGTVPATLAIYAVDGRAIMQLPLTSKTTTVNADLQQGVYLLRVIQGTDKHAVKIVIK